jgi:hypothetical protein
MVLKIIVHKGATIATREYSNLRIDYTVEAEVPSGMTAGDVIADLETMCDERISEQRQTAQQHNDRAKLEEVGWGRLPWKRYAHGSGEWIVAETKAAEVLLEGLQVSKGEMQRADYVYKLSKSESTGRLFIQRFPRSRAGLEGS